MFPCEDALFMSTAGNTEIVNSHSHGHEKHDGVDYCSPFCSCAVTNVVEITRNFKPVLVEMEDQTSLLCWYLEPNSNEVVKSVFQPPKS